MSKFTLTGNDIALAQMGVGQLLAWWEQQRARSSYRAKEIKKLRALKDKLSEISDHAYPYQHSDDMPLEVGDEPIMTLDSEAVATTRRAALTVAANPAHWARSVARPKKRAAKA